MNVGILYAEHYKVYNVIFTIDKRDIKKVDNIKKQQTVGEICVSHTSIFLNFFFHFTQKNRNGNIYYIKPMENSKVREF